MNWKLFSINKKESLVDILKGVSNDELRVAIPVAKPGFHLSLNPPKTKQKMDGRAYTNLAANIIYDGLKRVER
jgi:hypothetical protein